MFNVDKIIRLLGYVVWTILWLPHTILMVTVVPIMVLLDAVREGTWIPAVMREYFKGLVKSLRHEWDFIHTGKW